MKWVEQNYKAIAAVVVATLGAAAVALGPGDLSFGDLDGRAWLEFAIAVLSSGALVALVSNIPGVAGGVVKAVIAALTAGFGSLVLALDESSAGGAKITQAEWLGAVAVGIVASGVVYQVTEKPPEG